MKPIIIKPANREEWLKIREDGIGASEVAAIVGLSPWESPYSLWLRKSGQIPPIEDNEAMYMGRKLEGVVAEIWEEKTGFRVVKSSAKDIIYQDPLRPWRKVTPDRIAYEILESGKKNKCLLEIKTTRTDFDPDNLPDNYLCQCHYQMHITGIHTCYLVWLAAGLNFGYSRIEYDKAFAEWLCDNVDRFYLDCVKGGQEPELICASDYAIKGSEPGTTAEADEEVLSQILSLRTINAQITQQEAAAEDYKDCIKLFMEQAESLTYEGQVLATWKTGARGRTFLLKNKTLDELLTQCNNG